MAANRTVQPPNDYYGPLLAQHVRTVLESGLLLDEDYEVLLNASNFKIYPANTVVVPYGLIASSLATISSIYVGWKYSKPMVILPSLSATLVCLFLRRKAMLKRKRHTNIVSCIVKSFTKLRKLNNSIIRYLKLRKECKEKETLLAYNENIKEFVKYIVNVYVEFFELCLKEMSFLVGLTEELTEDHETVKELDLQSVLMISEDITDENHELLLTRIQDVYTFFTSKYLNYLGITFSKNVRRTNIGELEILLDKKLPAINTILEELYVSVQKEFNNLRYCTSKKLEIDMKNTNSLSRQVSGKLQQTLIGAVNNLSIIMEKSRAVLGKVEEMEDGRDVKRLESALGDLRDHAFATYESLDVLCKLYGILSDAKKYPNDKKFVKQFDADKDNSSTTLNYDDNIEALEENYELFIPETMEVEASDSNERCNDQSGIYLSLMLKELRQSLKKHERFMAARSKRGVEEDDDDDTILAEKSCKKVVPKFDLKAFAIEEESKQKLPPVPAPRASKVAPIPPPLPPPVVPEYFDSVSEEVKNVSDSKRSLFDNIKTLSSQLKGNEDVFGDDCDSDSD